MTIIHRSTKCDYRQLFMLPFFVLFVCLYYHRSRRIDKLKLNMFKYKPVDHLARGIKVESLVLESQEE